MGSHSENPRDPEVWVKPTCKVWTWGLAQTAGFIKSAGKEWTRHPKPEKPCHIGLGYDSYFTYVTTKFKFLYGSLRPGGFGKPFWDGGGQNGFLKPQVSKNQSLDAKFGRFGANRQTYRLLKKYGHDFWRFQKTGKVWTRLLMLRSYPRRSTAYVHRSGFVITYGIIRSRWTLLDCWRCDWGLILVDLELLYVLYIDLKYVYIFTYW